MKHIKLLFSISLLTFFSSLKSQHTFIDSSIYYIPFNFITVSQGGNNIGLIKEFVHLDSTNSNGNYYTIQSRQDILFFEKFNFKYNIRVLGDSVFYTGPIMKKYEDTIDINDMLVYNFSLKVGDTLKIKDKVSGFNRDLIIDSIKNVTYEDSIPRKTQFYSYLDKSTDYNCDKNIFFASKGLGSNIGLLPFSNIRYRGVMPYVLIKVCEKEKNSVYSNSGFGYLNSYDKCLEDSIEKTIKSLSLKKSKVVQFSIYPNPANTIIHFKSAVYLNKNWQVSLFDLVGKEVCKMPLHNNSISTESLTNGTYFLKISNSQTNVFETHKITILH